MAIDPGLQIRRIVDLIFDCSTVRKFNFTFNARVVKCYFCYVEIPESSCIRSVDRGSETGDQRDRGLEGELYYGEEQSAGPTKENQYQGTG